jgi:hypothetical protein
VDNLKLNKIKHVETMGGSSEYMSWLLRLIIHNWKYITKTSLMSSLNTWINNTLKMG